MWQKQYSIGIWIRNIGKIKEMVQIYLKKEIGKEGEDIAEKYLKANGYEIVDRNFYARQGEIDIIAKQNKEWVFIEVKTRTNDAFGKPIEAVDNTKQKHLIKAIKYYIYSNRIENQNIRVDVIEVYKIGERHIINHIKQVI